MERTQNTNENNLRNWDKPYAQTEKLSLRCRMHSNQNLPRIWKRVSHRLYHTVYSLSTSRSEGMPFDWRLRKREKPNRLLRNLVWKLPRRQRSRTGTDEKIWADYQAQSACARKVGSQRVQLQRVHERPRLHTSYATVPRLQKRWWRSNLQDQKLCLKERPNQLRPMRRTCRMQEFWIIGARAIQK